ncbi:hypothetical protein [Rhodococcus sp. NPDC003348]
MISLLRDRHARIADALNVIDRSGAAQMVEAFYDEDRLPGGRTPGGIAYTIRAVLLALMLRIIECTPPSYAGILATLAEFDADQLAAVGMAGQDLTPIRHNIRSEYRKFHGWLDRRLEPLDPGADLPAHRVTNENHKAMIAARTADARERAMLAVQRIDTLLNRIVAASVEERTPNGYCGDLVADESIFDLAGPSAGLGSRPDKHRAAAYCGKYYKRDKQTGEIRTERMPIESSKTGFGIGLTAISRVGPPQAVHAVAPVIVGIAVREPTSANVEAVRVAMEGMHENGLAARKSSRARWPHFVVDMGYNPKRGFADLLLDHQYSPVARYPKGWNLQFPAAHPFPSDDPDPGPIQIAGAFYCPAVVDYIQAHGVPETRRLLENKDFRLHDDRLRRLYPFLMGTNSRPKRRRVTRGRPGLGQEQQMAVTQEFVCPAAMGRLRCKLKPDSTTQIPVGVQEAQPTWSADRYRCCTKSTVTVAYTEKQLRLAQWNLVPGSWEHALYFEAARALTEQRFSLLKSPYVTGIQALKWGPRREPMIKIILALAVAATNLRIQASFDPSAVRTESMDIRWRQLTADLGHEPVRMPART